MHGTRPFQPDPIQGLAPVESRFARGSLWVVLTPLRERESVCVLKERQIRLMTNSHKSQSEKLATGGGRETTAEKRDRYV